MRVVVKLGTSVVTSEDGSFAKERLKSIVKTLSEFQKTNDVIVVSSGAVGLGCGELELERPLTTVQKQVSAAVGQSTLMDHYRRLFDKHHVTVAQVLLSAHDLNRRKSYLNVRHTIDELLKKKVVPILNENDTVSVVELEGESFGDNDRLSAIVAGKMNADRLVLLTDVDGVYDRDPKDPEALLITEISSPEELKQIDLSGVSSTGSGGIGSKVRAARLAQFFGVDVTITSGFKPEALAQTLRGKGEHGTHFESKMKLKASKKWLGSMGGDGEISINEGALDAISQKGASLLSVGVTKVSGLFAENAIVDIVTESGLQVGRGVVSFSSDEIERIKGCHSSEYASILSRKNVADEVIHRDRLVVFEEESGSE